MFDRNWLDLYIKTAKHSHYRLHFYMDPKYKLNDKVRIKYSRRIGRVFSALYDTRKRFIGRYKVFVNGVLMEFQESRLAAADQIKTTI